MPPALTGRNVAGFAYLSLAGTALAFVLWFNGIRRLPTAAPPLLGLAAPVTGAVLGWIVLGQSLSPLQLTGFVVTLGAIAYGASLRGQELAETTERMPLPVRMVSKASSNRSSGRRCDTIEPRSSRPLSIRAMNRGKSRRAWAEP
jgi:probable blue pigment (indigoidine) exporter